MLSEKEIGNLRDFETLVQVSAGKEHFLPDQPLVRIRPNTKCRALDFRDLWAYRDLLYFLTARDIRIRYKQTVLGTAWAIIQPLFTMIIFTLFFGRLAGVPSDGFPYPLFAYAGLLPWIFFSNAVTNSGNSLVGSATLITKVYFPRVIIPAAAVTAGLLDFGMGLVILIFLMAYYRIPPTTNLIMLPVLFLLMTCLALAVGMWMSAINVRYRDIRYALPFLIQLWMFISPIIYPASFLPGRWRWSLLFNPLTGIIEGYRAALFGTTFPWEALAISTVLSSGLLIYSLFAFQKMEMTFADII